MNTLGNAKRAILLVCFALSANFQLALANNIFCSLNCNGQINISLSSSGTTTITPSMMGASSSSNCNGPLTVHIMDANGVDIGDVVDCNYVGQNLMVSVVDPSGANCWGWALIEDKFKPSITCSDITIPCNGDTTTANTGNPMVDDNCGILPGSPTYEDMVIDLDCTDPLYVTRIKRTWTVTDVNGNTNSCEQNIYLERADINLTDFPPMVILDCTNPNLDPSNTGFPTINGDSIGSFCNLKYTYNDNPNIPTCGGGYKFVRTFLVIDCCTNEVLTGNQLIEVRDTTPPVITCPPDVTINTSGDSCFGSIDLPQPIVTDDCSGFDITVDFDFPHIGNLYTDIPQGTHQVIFTATDSCGNADTCSFKITVKDQISPIAICDNPTEISIGSDGTAKVYASTFDKASTDNCGIDTMIVRKMDDPDFSECLTFDCSEVGDTIMVVLRVIDSCDNYNECMVEAIIKDKLPPEIICPPDTILACTVIDSFIPDSAAIMDNCGLDTLYFQDDSTGFDLCTKTGIIKREWFATDLGGLIDSCTQMITVIDTTTLTFTFPPDTTISCTESTDPSNTGRATVDGGCRDISVVKEDTPLIVDVCEREIFRKWRFFDNCADTFLLVDSIQKIIVIDLELPTITCPDTVRVNNVNSFPVTCNNFAFIEAVAMDSCSGIESIINDSPFQINPSGFSASGLYPIGEYTVTFTAVDSCGNEATCVTEVESVDSIGPSFICPPQLVIQPFQSTVTVDISLFVPSQISGGSDACDPNPPTFSIDLSALVQPTWACADINQSSQIVDNITIIASDIYGNTNTSCSPPLRIICPEPLSLAMAGIIYTPESDLLEDVMVKIDDGTDSMMNYSPDGFYLNDDLIEGNDYTVTPEKDINPLNGVTTYDLVLIRKHILGMELLDSPYKIIAADANNSGNVTALDLGLLRALILHSIDELPNNKSWRFVDAHYAFVNPLQPLQEDFPEHLECVNVTETEVNMNFIAIKVGDVNATAMVNNLATVATRNLESSMDLITDNFLLEKDKEYTIPIFAKDLNELQGFQFTMTFDPTKMDFLAINDGWLKTENFGIRHLDEGAITCSWVRDHQNDLDKEEPLFSLTFQAKTNDLLENLIQLNSKFTTAEAYDKENKIHGIHLQFLDNGVDLYSNSDEVLLFQNQPNPFSTSSEIQFFIPQATIVELQVLDISGKIIHTYRAEHQGGFHKILVESNIFPAPGVYLYKLITPTFSGAKKMLVID